MTVRTDLRQLQAGLAKASSMVTTALTQPRGLQPGGAFLAAKSAAKGLLGVTSKLGDLMPSLLPPGMAGTLAAGAGLFGIGKAATDFEFQMARVQSIIGSSTTDMAGDLGMLRNEALAIGGSTQFSASEAAKGMFYFSQAGLDAKQTLMGIRPVLDLAIAGQLSLEDASLIAARSMMNQQMTAQELTRVVDVLAKASNISATGVREIGLGLTYVGATAKTSGFQLEETVAALSSLSNVGIDSTRAGTGLRTAMAHLANPSREAKGIFEELGIELAADGKFKPLADIVDELNKKMGHLTQVQKMEKLFSIFEQRGGETMLGLMSRGGDELRKFQERLGDATGTADRMRQALENTAQGAFKKFQAQALNVGIALGENLLGPLTKFLAWMADAVRTLPLIVNDLKQLNDAAGGLPVVIGGIGLALAALQKHPVMALIAAFVTLRTELERNQKALEEIQSATGRAGQDTSRKEFLAQEALGGMAFGDVLEKAKTDDAFKKLALEDVNEELRLTHERTMQVANSLQKWQTTLGGIPAGYTRAITTPVRSLFTDKKNLPEFYEEERIKELTKRAQLLAALKDELGAGAPFRGNDLPHEAVIPDLIRQQREAAVMLKAQDAAGQWAAGLGEALAKRLGGGGFVGPLAQEMMGPEIPQELLAIRNAAEGKVGKSGLVAMHDAIQQALGNNAEKREEAWRKKHLAEVEGIRKAAEAQERLLNELPRKLPFGFA